MKKAIPIFLLILIISGCTQIKEHQEVEKPVNVSERVLFDCTFPHFYYSFKKNKIGELLSETQNISEFTNYLKKNLLNEIDMARKGFHPSEYHEDFGKEMCDNPKDECVRYRCRIFDAVNTSDLSICQEMPQKLTIIYHCENETEIKEWIERTFGIDEFLTDYLQCPDHYLLRNYYKAKGRFLDGEYFELFDSWDHSPSGFAYRGACFSLTPPNRSKFEKVKSVLCKDVFFYDEDLKNRCMSDELERIENNTLGIFIYFYSDTNENGKFIDFRQLDRESCYGEDEYILIQDICKLALYYSEKS